MVILIALGRNKYYKKNNTEVILDSSNENDLEVDM